MKPIRTFTIVPRLPAPLYRLRELALNLNWAWNHDTIELCRRLDSDLSETSGHNPVMMLGRIEQRLLEETAAKILFSPTSRGCLAPLMTTCKGCLS
jgi:glycogen phosphorylase